MSVAGWEKTAALTTGIFISETFFCPDKATNLATIPQILFLIFSFDRLVLYTLPCLMGGRHQPGRCIRPNAET